MGLGIYLLGTSHSFPPTTLVWDCISLSPFDRWEDQGTGSLSNRHRDMEQVNCKTEIQTRTSGWRVHALGSLHDPWSATCSPSSPHGHSTVMVTMYNLPTAFPDNLIDLKWHQMVASTAISVFSATTVQNHPVHTDFSVCSAPISACFSFHLLKLCSYEFIITPGIKAST